MSLTSNYRRRVWWALRPLWLWRLSRLLLRSLWVSSLAAVIGWLGSVLLDLPLSLTAWTFTGAFLFLFVFCVLAFWPVGFTGLLQRLDRALGLRNQLGTAYEVAARGPQNYLEARLLRTASGSLQQANRKFWRSPAIPWADLEMCVLVAAIVYAVFANFGPLAYSLLAGEPLPLPPLSAEPEVVLPGLPPEMRQAAPPFAGAEPGAGGEAGVDGEGAQEALDALAEALSGQSITQSAGAALAAGQGDEAAEELRELAEAAGEISPEARQSLGQSLDSAAGDIQDAAPEAAADLSEAAEGLQSGDSLAGAEALDSLARLVEDLQAAAGQSGEGGEGEAEGDAGGAGLGANAGREAQPGAPLERFEGEGETVELPQGELNPDEAGVIMPPGEEPPGEGPQRSTPYTEVSPAGGEVGQVSDPLTYPWRLRNVVQQYFSPP
jgi:hypothetical protein